MKRIIIIAIILFVSTSCVGPSVKKHQSPIHPMDIAGIKDSPIEIKLNHFGIWVSQMRYEDFAELMDSIAVQKESKKYGARREWTQNILEESIYNMDEHAFGRMASMYLDVSRTLESRHYRGVYPSFDMIPVTVLRKIHRENLLNRTGKAREIADTFIPLLPDMGIMEGFFTWYRDADMWEDDTLDTLIRQGNYQQAYDISVDLNRSNSLLDDRALSVMKHLYGESLIENDMSKERKADNISNRFSIVSSHAKSIGFIAAIRDMSYKTFKLIRNRVTDNQVIEGVSLDIESHDFHPKNIRKKLRFLKSIPTTNKKLRYVIWRGILKEAILFNKQIEDARNWDNCTYESTEEQTLVRVYLGVSGKRMNTCQANYALRHIKNMQVLKGFINFTWDDMVDHADPDKVKEFTNDMYTAWRVAELF